MTEPLHDDIHIPRDDIDALIVEITVGLMMVSLDATHGTATRVAVGEYRTTSQAPLEVAYRVEGRTGYLNIEQHGETESVVFKMPKDDYNLRLSLANDVPITLKVRSGVGESTYDLTNLHMTDLDFKGGVGSTTITLPQRGRLTASIASGAGQLKVERAFGDAELALERLDIAGGIGKLDIELPGHGDFDVTVKTGVGAIRLDIPDTLAASVESTTGIPLLGQTTVKADSMHKVGQGRWQTTRESPNQARISVKQGMGRVEIVD